MKFLIDLKKMIFIFLFVFFHGGLFGQEQNKVNSKNHLSEHLNLEEDRFAFREAPISRSTSSTFMDTARLYGKIGVDIVEFSVAFPLTLEFEKPLTKSGNHKLLWLLQARGGFTVIKRKSKCSEENCSQTRKVGATTEMLPYGSAHTGFRYNYLSALTTSITLGTLFMEPDFVHWLTTLSIGWSIMDQAHVEFHMGFPIGPQFFRSPKPILLALSVGFPLKTW